MGEIKNKINKLSCRLNEMLRYGIKSDEYDEVLRLSQELDRLIVTYTRLSLQIK